MLDEDIVVMETIDKLHRSSVDATESGQRRNVNLLKNIDEEFRRELVQLAGGISQRNGRVRVSTIVERASCLQLRII